MQGHFDSSRHSDQGNFASYSRLTDLLMYPALRSSQPAALDTPLRLASQDLGGLLMLQLTRPPGTSARSMRHEPADAMFLSVLEAGPVILDTANQCLVQNTGDIVLWNADQRHEWRYEQGMSSTCVRLPRSWLSRMVPDLPASRLLPAGGPATGLLACMVRQLAALPSPHGTKAGAHLRSSLLHVLFATLSSGPCAEPSRLADAKQYMRARLDDTELTLQQVASSLGISLRSLARLFADEGSTPSRWLWSERVDQAHRLLESGEAQRVTDAALACGFTSFSHFSRAFRQAHGVPPSAVLNRAGG